MPFAAPATARSTAAHAAPHSKQSNATEAAPSTSPLDSVGPSLGAMLLSALVLLGPGVEAARPPAALAAAPAGPDTFTGPAKIVDGDTLYIGQEKFRLYGVSGATGGQA